jgi:2'-5' RNA ligase
MPMRLFLAIELPQNVRAQIVGSVRACMASAEHGKAFHVSWVREENVHITMKFLGDIADQAIPALADSLRQIEPVGNALLWAERIECFPPRGPVRVVAIGFGGDVDKLHLLHERVERACERVGVPKEPRRYSPHATVLRARSPLESHDELQPSLQHSLSQAASHHYPGPKFLVTEFVLIQSELTSAGPIYTPIARFPLLTGS